MAGAPAQQPDPTRAAQEAAPPRRAQRRRPLIAAALFGLLFVVSAVALIESIIGYHTEHSDDYIQTVFRPIVPGEDTPGVNTPDAVSFGWRGLPVELRPELDEDGDGFIALNYGEGDAAATTEIAVGFPVRYGELPLLQRTDEWLRVFLFVEPEPGETVDELYAWVAAAESREELERRARLAILAIRPAPGEGASRFAVPDTESWARTQRANWRFRFIELLPDGTLDDRTLRFPRSPTRRMYDEAGAELRGEQDPGPAPDELRPRTWENTLALQLIPRGRGPRLDVERLTALRVAGWTMPAAAFSFLGAALSLAFVFAPARRAA